MKDNLGAAVTVNKCLHEAPILKINKLNVP